MNELKPFIDTQQKFTATPDGIPATDHSQQMSYGIEIARRAAQAAQNPPEPPKVMSSIVPVAN